MTKAEALTWIRRARLDLRELEAEIRTPGAGWLEHRQPIVLELSNDVIGSAAAIQEVIETTQD